MTDNIRIALESELNDISTSIDVKWENKAYTPIVGRPYQISYLKHAESDNSTMGCRRRIDRGLYQITLCYPLNDGAKNAHDRADLIIDHFKIGTVLTSGGQNVVINKTPKKVTLGVMDERYQVAVTITYYSQVFN